MCYPPPGPRCSNHAYKEYIDIAAKFEACTDPSMKLILADRVEEKKAVYESTPKGQRELEREIHATTGLEQEQLKMRLILGKEKRQRQLEMLRFAQENKAGKYSDYMSENHTGYRKGRYQDACGIAAVYLSQKFKDRTFVATDTKTLATEGDTILVLPEKYSHAWGEATHGEAGYISSDVELQSILNRSFNPLNPTIRQEKEMMEWFIKELKENRYTSVASVNRLTEDTVVFPIEQLENFYHIKFRLKRKVGGSTVYTGDIASIEELLTGTPFEGSEVVRPERVKQTVVSYNKVLPRKDTNLNEELYLAVRTTLDGNIYYEVRRRHMSSKYAVSVVLTAKKQVTVTGVKDHTFDQVGGQEDSLDPQLEEEFS